MADLPPSWHERSWTVLYRFGDGPLQITSFPAPVTQANFFEAVKAAVYHSPEPNQGQASILCIAQSHQSFFIDTWNFGEEEFPLATNEGFLLDPPPPRASDLLGPDEGEE